jgi:pyrroline-5-carboxylate reductase
VAWKLLVVGGGKMGEALVGGLLGSRWCRPDEVVIAEVSRERRAQLTSKEGLVGRYPGLKVVAGAEAAVIAEAALIAETAVIAEAAVIAVKPGDVEGACRALAGMNPPPARALSLAAGARLADLERWCGEATAVVRAMPNVAALVGASATAISPGSRAGTADLEWAREVMGSVGTVVEVPERLLDAVTGLSGSGPAYLALVAEALTDAGVLEGLPREVASRLVAQTLLGTGRLLNEPGAGPEALRATVTSPGGTTAAGLRQLEARGARSAFIEAVAAAAERSRALGSPTPGKPGP